MNEHDLQPLDRVGTGEGTEQMEKGGMVAGCGEKTGMATPG